MYFILKFVSKSVSIVNLFRYIHGKSGFATRCCHCPYILTLTEEEIETVCSVILGFMGAGHVSVRKVSCVFQPNTQVYVLCIPPEFSQSLVRPSCNHCAQWYKALCEIASLPEVDTVMAAIVGAAGLPPALAAAQAGKLCWLIRKLWS